MKNALMHLGYEIPSGEPVSIPVGHLAVTGQTQSSGKTTALEALIARSGLRAISFVTKRGERGFEGGRQIAPYFEERADWEYVSGILESLRHEKMKFERAWIIRACKGARTLEDVQQNVRRLGGEAKGGMSADIYMMLGEYLSKVVPAVKRLPKADTVDLEPGLNVMSLAEYPEELQSLVLASTIKWIYEHEESVITIIPECWKFVPQSRNTPVKVAVEKLIREGAGLGNYIWLDSQDMAGVDKLMLRAAQVWLIGVQRESNEVKRALENIPAGTHKPKAAALAKLRIGEFFACWGENIHYVYVQPAWLADDEAKAVAQRKRVAGPRPLAEAAAPQQPGDASYSEINRLWAAINTLRENIASISELATRATHTIPAGPAAVGKDDIYEGLVERLKSDAGLRMVLKQTMPTLEVIIERPQLTVDVTDLRGRIARLIAEKFFTALRNASQISKELARRAWMHDPRTVGREMDRLTEMGFFMKERRGSGEVVYSLVPGMQVHVKEK